METLMVASPSISKLDKALEAFRGKTGRYEPFYCGAHPHYTADEERIQPPTPPKERKGDLFSRSRIPVHTSVRRILSVSEDSRYTASVQD
ncbi:hypothetical protein AXG93_2931s1710 [Marchantia polymorpha subsp. ruderalis]|uniref:Uncharacterized protein n=1 Tax=Marchantia polymorpha subsp. ruderalis TaxID=1480154 RepID=A0A176VYH0_MARPO|nr:hypothetical protein AXG93_2931s1710 [Marchantia polymorpha subsp. ruderalis]